VRRKEDGEPSVDGGAGCRVGAEYRVTSRDLGVFVDQAAEPVPPQDPDIRAQDGRKLAPGGRAMVECAELPGSPAAR
jgi:hypothetical protein